MRFLIYFYLMLAGSLVGCGSAPEVRQSSGLVPLFTRLHQDYSNEQSNPPRYFALFIPEHTTTRYTREKFRSDLIAASHTISPRDSMIYQDDWTRLFILPEPYRNDASLTATQEEYRLLMDSFDQGKPAGLLALRSQLAHLDRFRRLSGKELLGIDPWLQDMLRIPLDYLLLVDVTYLGYPDYLYEYEVSLTLKDLRSGEVAAYARGTVLLPYRLQ
jgi:hypothetical protein